MPDRPNRPSSLKTGSRLPFKKGIVVDATEMGTITELPNACAIIGGGVIAVEYANVLAGLGVGVSLLCKEEVGSFFVDAGAILCVTIILWSDTFFFCWLLVDSASFFGVRGLGKPRNPVGCVMGTPVEIKVLFCLLLRQEAC